MMPRAPRPYRVLLLLLPPGFRRDFGEELEALLVTRLREASGWAARTWIWLIAFADVVTCAAVEWARVAGNLRTGVLPGSGGMDRLTQDLRFALRSLLRRPGFAAVAVTTLALGIGAAVAVFSVVDAVLIRPLPYPDAERIVSVETLWTQTGRTTREASGPDFLDWQANNDAFETLAHYAGEEDVAIVVGDQAAFANDMYVSAGFFAVFGQQAAAGRLLSERDIPTAPADPTVVVVRHGWAVAHFGSADAAVGRTIVVYDTPMEIVGVAAPGFSYPGATDLWAPWRTARSDRGGSHFHVVGKLGAGVELATARARMRALGDELSALHPENRGRTVALMPLQERLTGDVQVMLWVLMAAVIVVLLIACANTSNLLLARAAVRTREVALRSALGAGRARVVRQLLTESAVLGAAAALVGLVLAVGLIEALVALSPADLPRLAEVRIDRSVLLFALGLSLATTLLFGLVPAIQASRPDLSGALAQGGSRGTTAGGSARSRTALVVAEVAMSVVLLTAAGLLLRSFQMLQRVDLGFSTHGVTVAYTQYPTSSDEDRRNRTHFYLDFLERVRALPGVTSAAGVAFLPLGREARPAREYFVEGRPEGAPGDRPTADLQAITPGFFLTLEIPLLAGRDFSATDTRESPMVAIVNETLARAAFPGESALGRRVRRGTGNAPWLEIVGVVADTRWQDPGRSAVPTIYAATAQGVGGSLSILARTSGDPDALAPSIRSLLRETNPGVPVRFETMDELFADALAYPRFRAQLIGTFAGVAALLAALGVFSVVAYLVGQRTREIAVRRAVGAGTGDVVRLIVVQLVRLLAVGLALGLTGAISVSGLLGGLLYGVGPRDAGTYVAGVAVLAAAALLATLIPVIRAAAIAPHVALQQE